MTLNVCQLKICTYIFNLFFSGVPGPERKKYLNKNALIFDISLLKHSKSDVRSVTHFKGSLLISLMLHNLF